MNKFGTEYKLALKTSFQFTRKEQVSKTYVEALEAKISLCAMLLQSSHTVGNHIAYAVGVVGVIQTLNGVPNLASRKRDSKVFEEE